MEGFDELEPIVITGKRLAKPTFSISEFKNNIGAVARPNLFMAEFVPGTKFATALNAGDSEFTERFPFRCEIAEFPGKTLSTIEDSTGAGPTLKLPYETTYNDINLTIVCSEDMKERTLFEAWMDYIIGPADSSGTAGLVRFYSDYAEGNKLIVSQLNTRADVLISFELYDVYPIAISPMTASWEETNTYQRFSVTMTYRYYKLG